MCYHLLNIVVCPICNGRLFYNEEKKELICEIDSLIYPFYNGIPVLLESAAQPFVLKKKEEVTL